MIRNAIALLGIAASLLLVSGCSSYNRAWDSYTPTPGDEFAGRWEGEWRSLPSGHKGALRCLMTPNEDGSYEAWFLSTWKVVLKHRAKTRFTVNETDAGHAFSGAQDLGKLMGGVYHYDGTTQSNQFRATYKNNFDHGVMEMDRLPDPTAP